MPEGNDQSTPAGQAPAGGQPGQAPQVASSPQAGASPPQPSSTPTSSSTSSLTPEQLQAEIARLSRELGDTRKEAAQHRTNLKKFEDAQLSDQQKLEKRASEAEAAANAYKQRVASFAVQIEAQRLGIIDPEVAAALIAGRLEFDDDGNPKNADKLLRELLVAKPYLAGGQAAQLGAAGGQPGAGGQGQPPRIPASSGGATNPGAGARAGVVTKAQYAAMSPQERVARNREVMETLRLNGGRLPE